jgi:hypothetical protein
MSHNNDERIRVVWFERADGYVHVPADWSRKTPPGYVRHEATTLGDIDWLTRRLNAQDKRKFDAMFEQDYRQMVEVHTQKKAILSRRLLAPDCSPIERTFIRSAFAYFDRKERECLHYTVSGYFQQRECDQDHKKVDDYGKQVVMPRLSSRLSDILTS